MIAQDQLGDNAEKSNFIYDEVLYELGVAISISFCGPLDNLCRRSLGQNFVCWESFMNGCNIIKIKNENPRMN